MDRLASKLLVAFYIIVACWYARAACAQPTDADCPSHLYDHADGNIAWTGVPPALLSAGIDAWFADEDGNRSPGGDLLFVRSIVRNPVWLVLRGRGDPVRLSPHATYRLRMPQLRRMLSDDDDNYAYVEAEVRWCAPFRTITVGGEAVGYKDENTLPRYLLRSESPGPVAISLVAGFDTVLRVYDRGGILLYANDDRGDGSTHSLVVANLRGTYILEVGSYIDRVSGDYVLDVREVDVGIPSEVGGTLSL